MNHAWPRFLPDAPPAAIAHALIIEAHAILVEQGVEQKAVLMDAHRRAMSYACSAYGQDAVLRAWNASAAVKGGATSDHLMALLLFGAEVAWQAGLSRDAAASAAEDGGAVPLSDTRRDRRRNTRPPQWPSMHAGAARRTPAASSAAAPA
jgi:hypothetical protein